jgi:2-polyprenyl-3-methyl-5-hydroxy-6-metoxy-1,4-benzoquinol methylase
MTAADRQSHWQNVYLNKGESEVSWTQADPQPSLGLIEKFTSNRKAAIVDIGGGASRLVDALLTRGFDAVTVLDLSEAALEAAKLRVGAGVANVQWVAADVTAWQPPRAFDIWHDRAAFHFLVDAADREAYLDGLRDGVRPGGHAIIATFALDGPEKCSGLAVQRYSPQSLAETVAGAFDLVEHHPHRHVTPWGALQSFQFSVLRRR